MAPTVDPYRQAPSYRNQRIRISSGGLLPTLIKSNLPSSLNTERIYASRLQSKQLFLENPAKESRHACIMREKKERKEKDKVRKDSGIISKSEARRKGLWDLHESAAKYDLFLSIHYMWQAYMAELFNLPPATLKNLANPTMPQASSMHPKLVKADFHGAIITVAEAKNADLVGLSGIVVHETENTFKIVTKKNQFKIIPKQNSVFTFRVPIYAPATQQIQPPGPNESPSGVPSAGPVSKEEALPSTFRPLDTVPCAEFQLYGNQFRFRSADRVNKKFKHKETIALI